MISCFEKLYRRVLTALALYGLLAIALSVTALVGFSHKAFAFSIDTVSAVHDGNRFEVSVSSTIELSDSVIQALRVNVPITIATNVKIYRVRHNFWDRLVADYEYFDQISSRSLYRDYVIDSSDEQIVGNYRSLNDVLTALGKQRVYVLTIDEENFDARSDYRGEVNITLLHSALPSVMHIPALFDAGWRLYTPWNEFDIT